MRRVQCAQITFSPAALAVAAVLALFAVLAVGCEPEEGIAVGAGAPAPDGAAGSARVPGAGQPVDEAPATDGPADGPADGPMDVPPVPPSVDLPPEPSPAGGPAVDVPPVDGPPAGGPPSAQPGGPRSIAVEQVRGGPRGEFDPVDIDQAPVLAAIDTRGRLALTLWGSSSCPTVPVAIEFLGRHEVRVTLSDDYLGMCTADYGPTTSFVALDPAVVDVTADLLVRLSGVEGLPPTVTARPLGS